MARNPMPRNGLPPETLHALAHYFDTIADTVRRHADQASAKLREHQHF